MDTALPVQSATTDPVVPAEASAEIQTRSRGSRLGKRVAGALIVGAAFGGLATLVGTTGIVWGSRGDRPVHSFTYRGEPAHVMRRDLILARDGYYVQFAKGDEMYRGRIRSDEGELIEIGKSYTPGSRQNSGRLEGSWSRRAK